MPTDVKSRTTINSHMSSQVKLAPPSEQLTVTKKSESAQGKENGSRLVLEMPKKDEVLRVSDLTVEQRVRKPPQAEKPHGSGQHAQKTRRA